MTASIRHPFHCEIKGQGVPVKLSLLNVVFLVLSILVVSSASADVETEGMIGTGYQSNLFSDSNSTGDAYAYAGMQLKYYPSASSQLIAGAKYNAFAKYSDLSNLIGDLSFTIIPTSASSALTLSLAGSVSIRKFGMLYKLYDQVGATAGANIGYRLTSWARWQSSVSYLNTSYINSDYGSNRSINIGTGLNFTVMGSNSLSLMLDYSRRSFDQPTLIPDSTGYSYGNDRERSETFEITGAILRYSRPIGEKTGINFSAGHRQLQIDNDYAVLGYTVDYLSPWADLWEGASVSTGLKHFFPNQLTTELSVTYNDKTYVDVVELAESNDETYWQDDRHDRLTTLSLSLSRPITLKNGKQLLPSFYLGYRKNQSSTGFFEYEDIQTSISVKVGF